MKKVLSTVGLILLFLSVSCAGPVVNPDASLVSSDSPSVSVGLGYCLAKENEEIESSLRQEIHELNNKIVEVMQDGNADELSGYFVTGVAGAQELRQYNKDIFPQISELIKGKELVINNDFYCTCSGSGNIPCVVLPKTEYDLQVSVDRISNEMFISLLQTNELNGLLLSFIYDKQDGQWKLSRYHLASFEVAGKNAVQWYEEALNYYNQGYLISAAFRLQLANSCLKPAPFLKYKRESQIEELSEKARTEIDNRYSFPIQLTDIESNPVIYYIRPQFVKHDIIPMVWYVTSIKLEDASSLQDEANSMALILQQMFPGIPGISEGKEYIAFKAFAEPPSDPNKTYTWYGMVVEVH
jgi:hypothetical protein